MPLPPQSNEMFGNIPGHLLLPIGTWGTYETSPGHRLVYKAEPERFWLNYKPEWGQAADDEYPHFHLGVGFIEDRAYMTFSTRSLVTNPVVIRELDLDPNQPRIPGFRPSRLFDAAIQHRSYYTGQTVTALWDTWVKSDDNTNYRLYRSAYNERSDLEDVPRSKYAASRAWTALQALRHGLEVVRTEEKHLVIESYFEYTLGSLCVRA